MLSHANFAFVVCVFKVCEPIVTNPQCTLITSWNRGTLSVYI